MPSEQPQSPHSGLQPDENQPDCIGESKPSLTIFAHKISRQITELNTMLSTSTALLLKSRVDIGNVAEEMRSLVSTTSENGKRLMDAVQRIENAAANQERGDTVSLALAATMEAAEKRTKTRSKALHDRLYRMEIQATELIRDQKATAESIVRLNEKLDRIIELGNNQSAFIKHKTREPEFEKPTTPAEKTPTQIDESVELFDLAITETTEDSENTPIRAKKGARKSGNQQGKNARPSQSTGAKNGPKSHPSTQVPVIGKSKRQRSISLGAMVDGTPGAGTNKDAFVVEETPEQDTLNATPKRRLEKMPENFVSLNKPEPKTPMRPVKKRMLAGPATQEAWENDSMVT